MYGVALDPAGNYLLLGGSGDEYEYSAVNSTTGWDSDTWVSYLVVLDTKVRIPNLQITPACFINSFFLAIQHKFAREQIFIHFFGKFLSLKLCPS